MDEWRVTETHTESIYDIYFLSAHESLWGLNNKEVKKLVSAHSDGVRAPEEQRGSLRSLHLMSGHQTLSRLNYTLDMSSSKFKAVIVPCGTAIMHSYSPYTVLVTPEGVPTPQ